MIPVACTPRAARRNRRALVEEGQRDARGYLLGEQSGVLDRSMWFCRSLAVGAAAFTAA